MSQHFSYFRPLGKFCKECKWKIVSVESAVIYAKSCVIIFLWIAIHNFTNIDWINLKTYNNLGYYPHIQKVDWFSIEWLPTHKKDNVNCKQHYGLNPNGFFMVIPFIRWVWKRQGKIFKNSIVDPQHSVLVWFTVPGSNRKPFKNGGQ